MPIERFIEAGRITNTHGVNGEVKIEVWLDDPAFLKKCGKVYINGNKYEFTSAKIQPRFLIAGLTGIDSINKAMLLKEKTVYIDRTDAKLKSGQCFLQDLIGAEVYDQNERLLGRVTEIFDSPAADIFVVKGDEEHMIPNIPQFIRVADAEKGIIKVNAIEGL